MSNFLRARLTAGQVEEGAVDGGDPEVGGAGVEQHGEVLWRGADADHAVVLGLGTQGREERHRLAVKAPSDIKESRYIYKPMSMPQLSTSNIYSFTLSNCPNFELVEKFGRHLLVILAQIGVR